MAIKLRLVLFILAGAFAALAIIFVVLAQNQRGTLLLDSANPIKLEINGAFYGDGVSFDIRLPKGNYKYKATLAGLLDKSPSISGSFSIKPREITTIYCAKNPKVSIVSYPQNAEVFLSTGEKLGLTPLVIDMPPGEYSFRFVYRGAEVMKGPLILGLDEEPVVEGIFGVIPQTGWKDSHKFCIGTEPDLVKVFEGIDLVGLTPVSFEFPGKYTLKFGQFKLDLPSTFDKQYTFVRFWKEPLMAISKEPYAFSTGSMCINGGFFSVALEDVSLVIRTLDSPERRINAPDFDIPVHLMSQGGGFTFVFIKNGIINFTTYDITSGNTITSAPAQDILRDFVTTLQSEDGKKNRLFFTLLGTLFEVDTASFECVELGKVPLDAHLRRIGSTEDFAIGVFNSSGHCLELLSRHYMLDFVGKTYVGEAQKGHPEVFAFHAGKKAFGIDLTNGEMVWEHILKAEIFETTYDLDSNSWFFDTGDPEFFTPIEAITGTVRGDIARKDMPAISRPQIGQFIGFNQTDNGMIRLIRTGESTYTAYNQDNREIWSHDFEGIFSQTGFSSNQDFGRLLVEEAGFIKLLDIKTGTTSQILTNNLLAYLSGDMLVSDDGAYIGEKRIVWGACSVRVFEKGVLAIWTDGGSCFIMPY